MIAELLNEFKSSIKSPDTEEKLDLVLYRPSGFLIAKISNAFLMTPTMLSILGLISGLLASYYYTFVADQTSLVIASFLFVLSGIFDSADGQLARISNQSTKLGLILDGICDSFVTIAIYIACSIPFVNHYGAPFAILVCLGLYLHSCQCAILDFYHREYLYFGYGKTEDDTYWNPGVADGLGIIANSSPGKERFMNSLRLSWIKKQQFLSSRSDFVRQQMRATLLHSSGQKRKNFMKSYRQNNLWLLPFWRLVGVNAHTVLLIGLMFLGRFDLYLLVFDIVIFNFIILVVGYMQKRSDQKFFLELKLNGHEN